MDAKPAYRRPDWRSLLPGNGPQSRKRATNVAGQIEESILADGWRCGALFGSLQSIETRFGAGRSVAREAIRILEIRGSGHLRRGPRGGLMVSQPDLGRVGLSLFTCLLKSGATVGDLLEARRVVDGNLAVLFAERPPSTPSAMAPRASADGISVHVHNHFTLRLEIARSVGNPALLLFSQCLADCSLGLLERIDLQAIEVRLAPAIAAYAAAVLEIAPESGRLRSLACEIDGLLLEGFDPGRRLDQLVCIDNVGTSQNALPQPIRISRAITSDILRGRWKEQERIGSEEDLCEVYGVSRMTFRQAVRILEEFEIAEMQPGRGNGLFVSARHSLMPAIRMAHGFLVSQHWAGRSWWQAMRPIQAGLIETAERKLSVEARQAYVPMVTALRQHNSLRRMIDGEMEIVRRITGAAGSTILHLFWLTIISYRFRVLTHEDSGHRDLCEQLSSGCQARLEAFLRGDRDASADFYGLMSVTMQPGVDDWASCRFF